MNRRTACIALSMAPLALAIPGIACAAAPDQARGQGGPQDSQRTGDMGGRMNGGAGGGMAENDAAVQAVIDANAHKFEQSSYRDPATGIELGYSLYVPEDYDEANAYPLVMFIPDSTGAGKTAQQIVEQYFGADVWVTDESQEANPCFVMVPAFSETVVDDNWNVSEQVEVVVGLLDDLRRTYSIDADRLYTTGQSMGCMTSLYLNATHPDLFAASLYVSGQWDITVLEPLAEQPFFYITAGGDAKASGGQDEVMALFDEMGVPYVFDSWSAQNDEEEQDAAVNAMLAENCSANFIRFETGSVLQEGQSSMEHMASFNYAYKLAAVRSWLFEQSR